MWFHATRGLLHSLLYSSFSPSIIHLLNEQSLTYQYQCEIAPGQAPGALSKQQIPNTFYFCFPLYMKLYSSNTMWAILWNLCIHKALLLNSTLHIWSRLCLPQQAKIKNELTSGVYDYVLYNQDICHLKKKNLPVINNKIGALRLPGKTKLK